MIALFVGLVIALTITVVVLQEREFRVAIQQERDAAQKLIDAQKELLAGQEQSIKGLRAYMEVKEAMLFDSIGSLITNLRFWMPDESQVVPDKEGDQWYSSVNAIFEAERRVRDIKESR